MQGRGPRGSPLCEKARRRSDEFEALVPTGWFRKYLEWTSGHESPAQFHFGAAITAVAGGLGRAPRIEWEARNLYPNLYALLVGPTGARKGSAMSRAVRLTVQTLGTNLLPNEGTHQGFAAGLRRRSIATGGLLSDGLIVADEFSVLMSKDTNKSDLTKWLTDWYDSPDSWERGLRGEEDYVIPNMYVSVLGGSNVDWLRTMPIDAITGGFLPRFILFDTPDKRFWCARPQFSDKLETELRNDLKRNLTGVPGTIAFSTDAGSYLDTWYEEDVRLAYESHHDEQYRAWLARKQAAAMKLATVWQLTDGGPKDFLAVEWLERARRVVDWGDEAVANVYGALGVSSEGQVASDVVKIIAARGGKATKKGIIKQLREQYTVRRITTAIDTLKASGEYRVGLDPNEGVTVWAQLSG